MPKFFIDKNLIIDNRTVISDENALHIAKVLRANQGDSLTLCDGEGTDYEAIIESVSKNQVSLIINSSHMCPAEPSIEVTLFQGLPKQSKMDYIIEKCTELGISRIVPIVTKRCVAAVRDDKAEEKKLVRWRKIALEAAKQCGRGVIPQVSGVMQLNEAAKLSKSLDLTVVAYENEHNLPLKTALENKSPKSIGIFIGPEGGFENDEIKNLHDLNVPAVSLGKRILRTETAGCAVLTAMMYEFNELK